MHTNYYKIFKLLKSFKIIIVVPTCFGLYEISSASFHPVLRQSYNARMLTGEGRVEAAPAGKPIVGIATLSATVSSY